MDKTQIYALVILSLNLLVGILSRDQARSVILGLLISLPLYLRVFGLS